MHTRRSDCRGCGGTRLSRFLSLGPTPLANAFPVSSAEFPDEARYPLDVYLCHECALVQLLDVIDPEVLFRDYIYVTGTSETITRHNREYAATVSRILDLGGDDLVVEVASNDGSLLRCFDTPGVRTLGVEPAENIAEMARSSGIATVNRFFDRDLAVELRSTHGRARAVIANNVLAHVDDTRNFLAGFRELLTDDGLAVIEVPYLREMIDRLEYDTIYHEHLCYFSVTAVVRLCEAVGLSVRRIQHVPVHGGSIRIYAERAGASPEHAPEVLRLAREEADDGLTGIERYRTFGERVEAHREELLSLLRKLRSDGRTLAAYGAPAKGNTLLNYCGIDADLIPFTVDRNPLKVGRYTPGTHIPVRPVSELLRRRPDHALILAWNFADEIIAQQSDYRDQGGRFVIPIPEPKVIV